MKPRGLGVDIQIIYADGDAITQSRQLLEIIQSTPESHPSGIIMEPAGGTVLPRVAAAAVRAGIGWVVLNRDIASISELRKTHQTPVFGVGSDNQMIGRMQGKQLVSLLPNGGSALYIQGPSDNMAATVRSEGMCETKGIVEVKLLRGRWTDESSYRAVKFWLQLSTSRQSNINAIAAQNDAMAMGARRAFEEVADSPGGHRWLDLPFLGVDGVQTTGQTWVKKGLLRATIIVPPNASKAVDMLVRAIQTGVLPAEMTAMAIVGFPSLDQLGRQPARKGFATGRV